MKKKLLALLVSANAMVAVSQEVKYKVVVDDPEKLPLLYLHLDPFYADTWGTDITMGWGLRGDVRLGKFMTVNGEFRKAYLDSKVDPYDQDLVTAKNGLKKHTYFEGVASIHLVDKSSPASLKIVLSSSSYSSGNYTYTTTKYIMVPGTKRKVFAVRGGLGVISTPIEFEDGKKDDATPIAFYGINVNNDQDSIKFGEYGSTVHGSSVYNGSTMMFQQIIAGGLSFKSITNLKVSTDWSKRGVRYNSMFTDFYFDVLINPVLSYKDVVAKDGTVFKISNDDQKRLGWRIGYSFARSAKTSLTYKFEFTSRPGFKGEKGFLSPNNSLLLTIGIGIPTFKGKEATPPEPKRETE